MSETADKDTIETKKEEEERRDTTPESTTREDLIRLMSRHMSQSELEEVVDRLIPVEDTPTDRKSDTDILRPVSASDKLTR